MRIDVRSWADYKLGDLFDIRKGKRLTREDMVPGPYNYLGAISSRNGVRDHIMVDDENQLFAPNCITVNYNGSVGEAFYQSEPFWPSDDVNVLYAKPQWRLDPLTALFIITVIKANKYKFAYGRKWTVEKMRESAISLPAGDDGPDWACMRGYIAQLRCKRITTGNKVLEMPMKPATWKSFLLSRLFDAGMGNGIDAVTTSTDNPKYNYVSRNSNGNGVTMRIDEIEGKKPFPAGSLTLALGGSYLGACFVQDEPFYTAQNVAVLRDRHRIPIGAKLFIATLVRFEAATKYQAFGRELNAHYKKDFTIRLPIRTLDGREPVMDESREYSDDGYVPDWEYMDGYVNHLPFADRIPSLAGQPGESDGFVNSLS